MAYPNFDVWSNMPSEMVTHEMQAFASELIKLRRATKKEEERVDIRDENLVVEVPEEFL